MIRLFIVFILLLNLFETSSNRRDKKRICWNQNQVLSWKDFTGKVSKFGNYDAVPKLLIEYKVISSSSIIVENCMVKNQSWVRKESQTPELLIHEQYHFNLSEVIARKIRREMSNIHTIDAIALQEIYTKWIEISKDEQAQYDKETSHNKINSEQIKWQIKIDNELDSLKEYQNEIIYLN